MHIQLRICAIVISFTSFVYSLEQSGHDVHKRMREVQQSDDYDKIVQRNECERRVIKKFAAKLCKNPEPIMQKCLLQAGYGYLYEQEKIRQAEQAHYDAIKRILTPIGYLIIDYARRYACDKIAKRLVDENTVYHSVSVQAATRIGLEAVTVAALSYISSNTYQEALFDASYATARLTIARYVLPASLKRLNRIIIKHRDRYSRFAISDDFKIEETRTVKNGVIVWKVLSVLPLGELIRKTR